MTFFLLALEASACSTKKRSAWTVVNLDSQQVIEIILESYHHMPWMLQL